MALKKSCYILLGEATQTTGQDPIEKAVTLQLGTLLTALNELIQTALLPGTCTITLLRELSRTYAILTTLVKYVCICPYCDLGVTVQFVPSVTIFSMFCFSTSRCAPASIVHCQLALRNW